VVFFVRSFREDRRPPFSAFQSPTSVLEPSEVGPARFHVTNLLEASPGSTIEALFFPSCFFLGWEVGDLWLRDVNPSRWFSGLFPVPSFEC